MRGGRDEPGLPLGHRVGFDQAGPHHSTFAKNMHERLSELDLFRELFEENVRRCLEAGFMESARFSVGGLHIEVNADRGNRLPREMFRAAPVPQPSKNDLLFMTFPLPICADYKTPATRPDAASPMAGVAPTRLPSASMRGAWKHSPSPCQEGCDRCAMQDHLQSASPPALHPD